MVMLVDSLCNFGEGLICNNISIDATQEIQRQTTPPSKNGPKLILNRPRQLDQHGGVVIVERESFSSTRAQSCP